MTGEELVRDSLVAVEVDREFTEAIVRLCDGSRLCFCHRVDQRWVCAAGANESALETGRAGEVLAGIATFRLNAKHLELVFQDGSRWQAVFS